MKGLSVKCPECNAAVAAGAETREIQCAYCGTLLVIQRRTRILQRRKPLPPRPPEAPPAKVATEEKVGMVIAVAILAAVAAAIAAPIITCSVINKAKPYGPMILIDVDGDGAEDLVALMRDPESEEIQLAAFAAKSGKRLWRSDVLRTGSGFGATCAAGAVVIHAEAATLHGVNLSDGEPRFQVRLDEAIKKLCALSGPQGARAVRVIRADRRAHLLSLPDGALSAAATSEPCLPLRCDRSFEQWPHDLEHREQRRWSAALAGIDVEKAIRTDRVTLALGHKTPGTSVPMIASVRPPAAPAEGAKPRRGDFTGGHGQAGGPEEIWRAVVPARDPLKVRGRAPDPDHVALNSDAVAVTYEIAHNSAQRLTVFELASGRRRFDVGLPRKMRAVWSVRITPHVVIVSSGWRIIAAYDVKSGEEAYTVD
jgi:DNA-directed RNA polymerase subunit RPC12/RpoP